MENNTFLGGHLVGIGKIKKNREIIYNELEKPIHNRITSVGLDHLFQFSGASNPDFIAGSTWSFWPCLWVSGGGNSTHKYRKGALNYMAFGSGTNVTSFNDISLENKLSDYSEDNLTASGSSQTLNGTRSNSYGSYSFRISHQSAAVSSATTVNEIGWFGAYDTTNAYSNKVLFARVVLPSPITLEAGESLVTTYQLDQTEANATASTTNNFFGLLDSEGNTLQAEYKLTRLWANPSGTTSWKLNSGDISEPYISPSGGGSNYNTTSFQNGFAPAYMSGVTQTKYGYMAYSTSSSIDFPAIGSSPTNVDNTFVSKSGTYSEELSPYTGVGSTNKYRDHIFTIGTMNPGISDASGYIDISAIAVNGMMYRFGYYDNGVWTPQMWRKYANQSVAFTFRTRYSTEDTTMS